MRLPALLRTELFLFLALGSFLTAQAELLSSDNRPLSTFSSPKDSPSSQTPEFLRRQQTVFSEINNRINYTQKYIKNFLQQHTRANERQSFLEETSRSLASLQKSINNRSRPRQLIDKKVCMQLISETQNWFSQFKNKAPKEGIKANHSLYLILLECSDNIQLQLELLPSFSNS